MSAPQKTIGGRVYSFGTIPAEDAVEVEVAIAHVIGEPLFKAFMDTKKTGVEDDDAEAAGMTAIGLMVSKMEAKELKRTMTTVFGYVSCDGKRIDSINETFTGRNRELWEVFIEALRVNFTDFFPAGLLTSVSKKIAK